MKKYISNSPEETRSIGREIGKSLRPGDVVALVGDLGAGKTAFVKGVAKALNSKADVVSPTYTWVNQDDGDITLYHFDVYRLDNPSVDECDWIDEYLFGSGICIIEWADNISEVLLEGTIRIEITKNPQKGTDYREITVC